MLNLSEKEYKKLIKRQKQFNELRAKSVKKYQQKLKKKILERKIPKSFSEKSIKDLHKELDSVFSKYIRARDNHICITCGMYCGPQKSENGHYISRAHPATYFDEMNCNCQCFTCNIALGGNLVIYEQKLIAKYGIHEVEKLKMKSVGKGKLAKNKFEYDLYIKEYETKYASLLRN